MLYSKNLLIHFFFGSGCPMPGAIHQGALIDTGAFNDLNMVSEPHQ